MKLSTRKEKLKRIFFASAICFAALFAVFMLTLALKALLHKKIPTLVIDETIRFAEPDYEYDIFSDPLYVSKERNIFWNEYGVTSLIGENAGPEDSWHGIASERVYAEAGEEQLFFRNFIVCLIKGDYERYGGFFTERFFKTYTLPDRFTPQKIYDISAEVVNRTPSADGTYVSAQFILRYKIMNNNGTYRGDVASDSVRPLIVTLYKANGSILIDSVSFLEGVKHE